MASDAPPPNSVPFAQLPLAYQVPSLYVNCVRFTYINGIFRVTFFEQQLVPKPEAPNEVAEILVPRTSVTMIPAVVADFLREFGNLYNRVAENIREGAATVLPEDETGRPN
jgi:hypothetical protein